MKNNIIKVFIITIFFLYGCNEDIPQTSDKDELEFVVVNNDEKLNGKILEVTESTLTLSGTEIPNQIKPGTYLVSDITEKAPYGYLRKVLSIKMLNNQVIIETDNASLTDVIKDASVLYKKKITIDDIEEIEEYDENGNIIASSRVEYDPKGFFFKISRDVLLYDADRIEYTKFDQVRSTIDVSMGLSLHFDIDINDHSLDYLKASAELTNQNTVTFTAGLDATDVDNISLKNEILLARWKLKPFTILIGGIPVPIASNWIAIFINAEGIIKAEISYKIENSATAECGLEYAIDKWQPYAKAENCIDYGPLSIKGEAGIKAGFGILWELRPYGLKDSRISFGPIFYAKLGAELTPENLNASLKWGCDVKAIASVTVFSKAVAGIDLSFALFDEKTLWESMVSISKIPTVTTLPVSDITENSATSGGNITSDEGALVTERGVCWSTSQNPTISSNKTNDGSGTGEYTSEISELKANTQYFVRAYATNTNGTAYGNEVSFTTQKAAETPLSISIQSLSLNINESKSVLIASGSGNYSVTSSSADIITSSISGNTITVKGLAIGNATATVIDLQTNQTASIDVTVTDTSTPPGQRPKLAIEYVAEYNVNQTGDGFTTSHSNDASGYFNWYEASGHKDSWMNPNNINFSSKAALSEYHLPNLSEWRGIFPLADISTTTWKPLLTNVIELIMVNGKSAQYTSDYNNMGNGTFYALRFKSEDNSLLCAYRYERVGNLIVDDLDSHFKVTVRYLGPDFKGSVDDFSNSEWWSNNSSDDVIRIFPACGSKGNDEEIFYARGQVGHYWATSTANLQYSGSFYFNINSFGMSSPGAYKSSHFSVRLFSNE